MLRDHKGCRALSLAALGVALTAMPVNANQTPASATPVVLADSSEEGSNRRVSGRGTRGLIKIGIFGVVLAVSGIGYLVSKSKNNDGEPESEPDA